MANMALVFDLLAKDNASGTFRNVGNAAERTGKQTDGLGSSLTGAAKRADAAALAVKGAVATFAGAAIVGGFKALYDAADESRKITALTAQVIKSTGGAAQVSAKQVGDLAGAIAKKTGVDDEAIQSGENLLLTFTNIKNQAGAGNDIFNQTTKIMTDMSVALGTDASGSAIQLGKALNDPIKGVSALQRVGVSFTASQKEQIKTLVETGDTLGAQKIILAELSKEFGGAAEAAATPLGKLQQRVGDVAEQFGGYLIPAVDKAATFFTDDLMPAAGNVAGTVGDVLGPALHIAADALGTIYSVGKGTIGLFNDLPEPIKLTVGALAATAALKGPVGSLFTTLKDTAESAYLKVLLAKDAIGGLGGAGGAAKAGLGGLTSFFGGPWGIALAGATVGITLLTSWLGKSDEATKRTKEATQGYADALRAANGVIDESVRQAAAKAAQDAGLLDIADDLGIALPDVTSAITDQGSALDMTRSRLRAYIAEHVVMLDANTRGLDSEGEAAQAALNALDGLVGGGNKAITAQQQLAAATAVTGGTVAASAVQTQAAVDAQNKLGESLAAFVDPLGAYTDLLSAKKEADRTAAEATAAGTESSKDSWKDYVKDVKVTFQEYMTALEDQVTAQANWQTNMLELAGRVSAGTLAELSKMGPEGAPLVADLVTRSDAELAKFSDLTSQRSKEATDAWGAQLTAAAPVLATIGKTAGQGVVNQLAASLQAGTTTVAQIAAQYGLNLAGGINPVLKSLGHTEIAFKNGTWQGFNMWSGGYTGDGGKYEPKGIVHGGEYVLTKEQTSRLGIDAIEAFANQGYANGGFVTAADVPKPRSTAPYGPPISTAGNAAMQKEYDATTAWLTANVAPAFTGMAGAGVQRWAPLVLQALSMMGQPASLLQTVLRRMNQESGGNPNAINLTDSNARAGHPSQGLMQTIPGTFAAYHFPGTSNSITDPLANILASMRYAMARYGSLAAAYNRAGGYELGTDYVPKDGMAYLHKGEAVVPAGANAGWTGGNLSGLEITGTLEVGGDGLARIVDGRIVSALTAGANRGRYNG